MVAEIGQDATLQGLGIYGYSIEGRVLTNGEPLAFSSADAGIIDVSPPVKGVPVTSMLGASALLLTLASAGVRAIRRR